jgi:hypothetical protein
MHKSFRRIANVRRMAFAALLVFVALAAAVFVPGGKAYAATAWKDSDKLWLQESGSNREVAYCYDPSANYPASSGVSYSQNGYVTDAQIRTILYYGYPTLGTIESVGKNFREISGISDERLQWITQRAVWGKRGGNILYKGLLGGLKTDEENGFYQLLMGSVSEWAFNGTTVKLSDLTTPPDTFKVKLYTTGGNFYQRLLTVEYEATEQTTAQIVVSKAGSADIPAAEKFSFTLTLFNEDGSDYTGTYTYACQTQAYAGPVKFELAKGEKAVFGDIPVGISYTVQENLDVSGNYKLATVTEDGVACRIGVNNSVSGELDSSGDAYVFTNALKSGELDISKEVVGATDADSSIRFMFQIEITKADGSVYTDILNTVGDDSGFYYVKDGVGNFALKTGQTVRISLPYGYTYKVTELGQIDENNAPNLVEDSAYVLRSVSGDGTTISDYAASGTINSDLASATFYNQKKDDSGHLVLEKKVVDGPANASQEFTFEVTLADKDGGPYEGKTYRVNYGDEKTYDGPVQVTLKDGECAVISGLEEGAQYSIVEISGNGAGDNGTYVSKSGTVDGTLNGNSAWVTYENGYTANQPLTKTLNLTKNIVFTNGGPISSDLEFSFRVTFYDANGDRIPVGSGITVSGLGEDRVTQLASGTYVVKLGDGETATFSGLPETYNYLIREDFGVESETHIVNVDEVTPAADDGVGIASGRTVITLASHSETNPDVSNVTYENKVTQYAGLIFSKELAEGTEVDGGETFAFEVDLAKDGKPFDGTLEVYVWETGRISTLDERSLTFKDGVATVELEAGQTCRIAGIEYDRFTYSVRETGADGYETEIVVPDDSVADVAVDNASKTASSVDGATLKSAVAFTFVNGIAEEEEFEKPEETTFSFSKRDADGEELAGATIELRDADGNTIETWVSDGTVREFTVEPGTYRLVETAAPEGYKIATAITVVVGEDGSVTATGTEVAVVDGLVVMIDDYAKSDAPTVSKSDTPTAPKADASAGTKTVPVSTTTAPKTGDASTSAAVLGFVGLAGLVAVAAGVALKRVARS